jgi:hypothetical protein
VHQEPVVLALKRRQQAVQDPLHEGNGAEHHQALQVAPLFVNLCGAVEEPVVDEVDALGLIDAADQGPVLLVADLPERREQVPVVRKRDVDVHPPLVQLRDHGGGDVRQAPAVAGPDEVGEVPHVLGQRHDLRGRHQDDRQLEIPRYVRGGPLLEDLV